MLANVGGALVGFGPDDFAVHDDIDVVLPFRVVASLAHVQSTHWRLLENLAWLINLSIHLLVHSLIHFWIHARGPPI